MVGKCMLKPLKLLVNAFPTLRIALHPEIDNARRIAVSILYSIFFNISPPRLMPVTIIPHSVHKGNNGALKSKKGSINI
jgi:hypothetical protein